MEDTTLSPTAELRRMAEAELARSRPPAVWPEALRTAWRQERAPHVAGQLNFFFKIGLALAIASSLLDLVAIPALVGPALLLRLATIGPLTALGLWCVKTGRFGSAKAIMVLTISLFGVSAMWVSSYATSDVIARYSMAIIVLMVMALFTLPFTLGERRRFALVFSLATVVAGLGPNPLPAILLLQHMVLSAIAGLGGFAIAQRLGDYESREFLRSLKQRFDREELEQSNALLRELSESDPLTGLANRRSLERVFDEQFSDRAAGSVVLMMIDLDHFKAFNDRHGHQAGDRCLMEVARELERCLSSHGGHAARFGGEEFVAVFLERPTSDAAGVAEELRASLSRLAIPTGASAVCGVTASIGVVRTQRPQTMGELIARADEALYRAKQNGRNRVEVAYAALEELG